MTNKMRVYDKGKNGKHRKKSKKNIRPAKPKVKTKDKKEVGGGSQDDKTSNKNVKGGDKIPELKELERDVLKYIIGQDDQVRQIITSIYRTLVFPSIKSNILIIGNSGTGKTATIKQIAQMLGLPCTIEDATKYTQEGYYGADVTDMVFNLIENADNDIARAWNGIIVIDEIDKKANSGDQHDVAGVEVLKSLLKIIEGTTVMVPPPDYMGDLIPFDTHNLVIIFMGAFPGLERIRDLRLNKNSMGFARTEIKQGGSTKYIKQDLVKYGLPEEFVGRIDTIVEMNNLGYQELVQILKQSKLSIFRRYQVELKRLGLTLEYDDELFAEIAKASLVVDTGARELSNTVNHVFEKIIYEVLSNPEKYKKCRLLPGIVQDNSKFELT
ncbi:MAG: AAA family ATPase [Clostridia bacterium]|nr:AAA family ATPase [Clostridia bacterium]